MYNVQCTYRMFPITLRALTTWRSRDMDQYEIKHVYHIDPLFFFPKWQAECYKLKRPPKENQNNEATNIPLQKH